MYYVYKHVDPITEEIVYIGYGSRDRAWKFPPLSPNFPSANRQPNHIAWMEEKTKEGFIPADWVKIVEKFEYRDLARELESSLIKKIQPKYNLRNCNRSPRRIQEEVIEMKKLYKEGLTLQQIGSKYNISRQTVKRYIDGVSKPRAD